MKKNEPRYGLTPSMSGTIQGAGGVGGLVKLTYYGAQTTTNAFLAYDGNGNVMGLFDAGNGSLVAGYEYGPFGEVIRATGPMAKVNPIRFSTQYTDDETDLVCYLHRYYNPSTGRWLSRDPISEYGGQNLYAMVSNDPIGLIDLLGLVEYKFEVVRGDPSSDASIFGASGRWGQPWWCADGSYSISGALADSTVTITSRNASGGACNTVDKPDPAGTILLYIREEECPGNFDIAVNGLISVSGTGPRGAARGKFEAGGSRILDVFGTTSAPVTQAAPAKFRMSLNKRWKLAAKYTPTISFPQDNGTRSTGTAYGIVQYVSATRVESK